ncbi:MAG: hypothetical protein K0Q50_2121 [Vampirovibrio sp.]|jgi:septal ring factor EnvC (AmiA/AmiB activator)|nr:hypothetical protein [Vampirovibrio sp.]
MSDAFKKSKPRNFPRAQKGAGASQLLFPAVLVLVVVVVYQQLQIGSLKHDLKYTNQTLADTTRQLQAMELKNDQVFDILKQFESRIGYMDNKVEHVIEDNTEKEQQLQAASEQQRAEEHEDMGILSGLARLFRN